MPEWHPTRILRHVVKVCPPPTLRHEMHMFRSSTFEEQQLRQK